MGGNTAWHGCFEEMFVVLLLSKSEEFHGCFLVKIYEQGSSKLCQIG